MKHIDQVIAHYETLGVTLTAERAEALVRETGAADGKAYLKASRQMTTRRMRDEAAPAGTKFADPVSVGFASD